MDFSAATRQLKARLGPRVVRTDAASRWAASFDSSKIAFAPAAAIFPRNRADVAAVLDLANRRRVPVTVRGRGTSLTGSASPARGGWVLDLHRWNKVRIDAQAGMAHVQAGATVERIQAAAEKKGWFYPPDPSSKKYCTIGGNIACNAGGMHGGKYGVTRDFVLALKGFLPTGEWVEWGTPTKKFSAGFNLRDLWIGSEGMLGIVTEATLKLIPRPAERWTLLVSFRTEPRRIPRGARALRPARAARDLRVPGPLLGRVRGARDRAGRSSRARRVGRSCSSSWRAAPRRSASSARVVLRWAERHGLAHRAARTRAEADELWEVRRACSGAMFEMGDSKLNEDVVVPMGNYLRFRPVPRGPAQGVRAARSPHSATSATATST